jgi:hypothetical protein
MILVMGVSGCGKTTAGSELASALGYRFVDADDYHPRANVEKMRAGQPLDDHDREPWLSRLNALLRHSAANSRWCWPVRRFASDTGGGLRTGCPRSRSFTCEDRPRPSRSGWPSAITGTCRRRSSDRNSTRSNHRTAR